MTKRIIGRGRESGGLYILDHYCVPKCVHNHMQVYEPTSYIMGSKSPDIDLTGNGL